MKRLASLFFVATNLLFGSPSPPIEDSVVKLYLTRNIYDYHSPWCPPSQVSGVGSAFIISENRILTNAHVVADSAFIQLKKPREARRYIANAQWIGHDCDLAILKPEDEAFFTNTCPLELAEETAPVSSHVRVLGYPLGGEGLTITEGIISRTEVGHYSHGGNALLCSQIDAPINPGNSGSPVIRGSEVVGVAHQGNRYGQNVGYMIPVPIIRHFLKEVGDGKYVGFPKGGVLWQSMDNEALRSFYQVEGDETGVLISAIYENSLFEGTLFPGDILLSVDGIPVATDGTVDIEGGKRISFFHLFSLKYYDDLVYLGVLRDGVRTTVPMILKYRRSKPLGEFEYDKRPTYFVLGGLVFQPLTLNYLAHSLTHRVSSAVDLICYLRSGRVPRDCSQVVVLTRVLPDSVNEGYQEITDEVVTSVNGVRVRDMKELVKLLETAKDPYHQIKLDSEVEIILGRNQASSSNERIKTKYCIHKAKSKDLR